MINTVIKINNHRKSAGFWCSLLIFPVGTKIVFFFFNISKHLRYIFYIFITLYRIFMFFRIICKAFFIYNF